MTLLLEEMKDLQVDVTSLPAQILIPFLKNISFNSIEESLKENLFTWNFKLNSNSISAASLRCLGESHYRSSK